MKFAPFAEGPGSNRDGSVGTPRLPLVWLELRAWGKKARGGLTWEPDRGQVKSVRWRVYLPPLMSMVTEETQKPASACTSS